MPDGDAPGSSTTHLILAVFFPARRLVSIDSYLLVDSDCSREFPVARAQSDILVLRAYLD